MGQILWANPPTITTSIQPWSFTDLHGDITEMLILLLENELNADSNLILVTDLSAQ